jgi:hypothetical protein
MAAVAGGGGERLRLDDLPSDLLERTLACISLPEACAPDRARAKRKHAGVAQARARE